MKWRDSRWLGRLSIGLVWLLATVAIAWVVASRFDAAGGERAAAPQAPLIELTNRQVVSLESHTIQSVISSNGTVIEHDDGFALQATVDDDDLAYRLLDEPIGVKALIAGGPAGFDCAWLGLAQSPDGRLTMRCSIPDDIRVVSGMNGTMSLAMSRPKAVMALPISAVIGSAERGEVVLVLPDDLTEVRPVQLGVADTFWIEIVDGLSHQDRVLQNPVQSDFLQAGS